MATLTVRNMGEDVIDALNARQTYEVRMLLSDVVNRGSRASLRDLADRIAALTPKVPQTDSTDLVREVRAR